MMNKVLFEPPCNIVRVKSGSNDFNLIFILSSESDSYRVNKRIIEVVKNKIVLFMI